MSKIIICIHGLANKPKKETLLDWWKSAIDEGLYIHRDLRLGNQKVEMAYYTDIYYAAPVPDDQNDEPYKLADPTELKPYRKGFMHRLRKLAGNVLDTPIDWLEERSGIFSKLAEKVTKKVLKDLGQYYNDESERDEIKKRLSDLLIQHKKDEIILIAHSMGTIVSYDVLRELGRDPKHKDLEIEHFITIGSPLGFTPVKGKILKNNSDKLRTPSCVTRSWTNFSDPQDYVCIDSHLKDDYETNSAGIRVNDVMVCNDYPGNEHKSYGYLRTPEFSEHLANIL